MTGDSINKESNNNNSRMHTLSVANAGSGNQWSRDRKPTVTQTQEQKAAHTNFSQMLQDSAAATDVFEDEMLQEMATPQ